MEFTRFASANVDFVAAAAGRGAPFVSGLPVLAAAAVHVSGQVPVGGFLLVVVVDGAHFEGWKVDGMVCA